MSSAPLFRWFKGGFLVDRYTHQVVPATKILYIPYHIEDACKWSTDGYSQSLTVEIFMRIWSKQFTALRFRLRYGTVGYGSGVGRILCYGDSNTWGYPPGGGRRMGASTRWAGVLQRCLGPRAIVFEEGLSGRTTEVDDPQIPGCNGRASLMPIVRYYAPLDVIILALGTNDLKRHFNRPASVIAEGVGRLCGDILNAKGIRGNFFPEILLIAPPPIRHVAPGRLLDFSGAVETSMQLPGLYHRIARRMGVRYMEAGAIISASRSDPVHWDSEAHLALGQAVADRVAVLIDSND
jgi:lysophospholipase L1-like esterase